MLPLRGVIRNNAPPKSWVSESVAVGSAWWTVLEVLLLRVWQNNGKPVKLTLSDGWNWYIFYKKGDQDQYWKKGIGNIDPPTGLRYRVSIYRKFLLSVVEVGVLADLIQLELLSYFSRDREKGNQIVLKWAKIEYRTSSKKRPGAYFKFQLKGWALIRRRALNREGSLLNELENNLVVPGKFTVFTKSAAIGQKLKDER